MEDRPTYRVKNKEPGEEKQVAYYKIDKSGSDSQAPRDTAQHFDAFYFLGPTDVQDFFSRSGGTTLTSGIETHFARKFANDPDFRDAFSVPGITWDSKYKKNSDPAQDKLRAQWDGLRRSYLKFYSVGASVNFSLGSHDEWNIFRLVNKKRRERYGTDDNRGIAEQLGGFFDGSQIDPASTESFLSKGYAIRTAGDRDECRISTEGSPKALRVGAAMKHHFDPYLRHYESSFSRRSPRSSPEAYHVHLMHLDSVLRRRSANLEFVGKMPIGIIRKQSKSPKSVDCAQPAHSQIALSVRGRGLACLYSCSRGFRAKSFQKHPERYRDQLVPPFLYLPDSRVIPAMCA